MRKENYPVIGVIEAEFGAGAVFLTQALTQAFKNGFLVDRAKGVRKDVDDRAVEGERRVRVATALGNLVRERPDQLVITRYPPTLHYRGNDGEMHKFWVKDFESEEDERLANLVYEHMELIHKKYVESADANAQKVRRDLYDSTLETTIRDVVYLIDHGQI